VSIKDEHYCLNKSYAFAASGADGALYCISSRGLDRGTATAHAVSNAVKKTRIARVVGMIEIRVSQDQSERKNQQLYFARAILIRMQGVGVDFAKRLLLRQRTNTGIHTPTSASVVHRHV
jgi:hypothetical protein